MKELSIEEKARHYDEAIERAKEIHTEKKAQPFDVMLKIFPELKESEGERIRKEIIQYIKTVKPNWQDFVDYSSWIAWLEKQGKQKPAGQREECSDCQFNYAGECKGSCAMKRGEQKPAGKIESKFKIEKGKWYVCIKDILDNYANKAFRKGDTYLSTQDGSLIPSNSNIPFEVVCPDTYFRDWTIKDAKAGDVLEFGDHGRLVVGIVSYVNKTTGRVDVNCLLENNNFKVGIYFNLDTIKPHPATKEQRDLLFQKMREAGYEWDSEKNKLNKIEDESTEHFELKAGHWYICHISYCCRADHLTVKEGEKFQCEEDGVVKGFVIKEPEKYFMECSAPATTEDEQKPAWSKEDDAVLNALIRRLEGEDVYVSPHLAVECLKSLKDRVQPKQEWSDVDKDILFRTIDNLKFLRDTISIDPKYAVNIIDIERGITWLKSLRPQTTWKPSDEQMDALHYVTNFDYGGHKATLVSLYEQLKKLREE